MTDMEKMVYALMRMASVALVQHCVNNAPDNESIVGIAVEFEKIMSDLDDSLGCDP